MKISNLKCEYKVNPVGVDITKPRLSWNLVSSERGVSQTAYRLEVASSIEQLMNNNSDLWDSKKIKSNESIHISYQGEPLESNKKYFWKVTVWDQDGNSHSSDPAFWTTGLINNSDWKAKWIGLDKAVGDDDPDAPHRVLSARMLRNEFEVEKEIESATAFISGLGLFELYINGERIGDQVLAPGLTEYNKRTFYVTFDITKNLNAEKNSIGVILGNGRYFAPRKDEPTKTRTYGYPKLLCQIEIKYKDSTTNSIISDESWKITTNGPIRKNNEYDGEYYDARMELDGWHECNYDDSDWSNAQLVEKPGELLVSQPNEQIKIMEELTPISVNELSPGVFIYDMGQNMVGWVELFVKGNKGGKVTLRFSETLKEDGSLFLDNIRGAEVTDTYILKGDGNERWEPKFTYHGFRFVEMIGYPGEPKLSAVKGKVIHDALDISGSFECSNTLINDIYKNAYWGIRGNYRSMPTDCPQRDERQGWLGDRSAECTGESYIFNISNLYNKWMVDIQDAQMDNGSIPDVAPSYWPFYSDNTTWPGTYLFASDMLYTQYGDLEVIKMHYSNMKKWINHMRQYVKEGVMTRDTYGDWCVPPEDVTFIHTADPNRTTSSELIGTAYFYYELKLMEKFAKLLDKQEDQLLFAEEASQMKEAFVNNFIDTDRMICGNNSQTSNILAIMFDLVPKQYRERIFYNLLEKIMGEGEIHVGTGIVGGQWLTRVLTSNGYSDVAYLLASQNTYPSWGYMVEQGATTIWELWNGDHGDPGMNSGNHVMLLGDLIIWFYQNLAGIKPDPNNPGFKNIIMKPEIVGDLKFVNASYNSMYGKIKSNWRTVDDKFYWDVSIPGNTSAMLYIPSLNPEGIKENNQLVSESTGVKFIEWKDNRAIYFVESGSYSFSSEKIERKVTELFLSTPKILPNDISIMKGEKMYAKINCKEPNAVIRFTTDGSSPNEESSIYIEPILIDKSTVIKAKSFMKDHHPSSEIRVQYDYIDPEINGITWELYEGNFKNLPDFEKLNSVKKGKVYQFDFAGIDRPKYDFALRFSSNIKIMDEGEYTFSTVSNDGSSLYINGKKIVDNDGEHAAREMDGKIYLTSGTHSIVVEYFQTGGSTSFSVNYKGPNIEYQKIPGAKLFQ
jgi:alpha-L-rhamnosidase